MNIIRIVKNRYRVAIWRIYDRLYQITKNEKFYYEDSEPTYSGISMTIGTPIIEDLPFFLYVPHEQIKGKEYFIVADHFSRFKCTKIAKISFYEPRYVRNCFYTGKKRWVLTTAEKEKLAAFLEDNSHSFTSGYIWYENMIYSYNRDVNFTGDCPEIEIKENLKMPDYRNLADGN